MRLLLLLAALLLTACTGERIEPAPTAGQVYELPPINWHVVDRVTLERVYTEAGMKLGDRDKLQGFTGVDAQGHVVIYTLPPQHVDDAPTLTVGHEVLHVALGDYHK